MYFSSQQHNPPQVHFNQLKPILSIVKLQKKENFHHVLLHLDAN